MPDLARRLPGRPAAPQQEAWITPKLKPLPVAAALVALTAALATAPLPARAELVAGRDYMALARPLQTQNPGKLEVIEFFSYACAPCAELHPLTARWSTARDVAVRRIPVAMGRPQWTELAILYFTLENLGQLSRLDAAVFDAINRQGARLSDRTSITEWAAAHGIDRKTFNQTANSFAVTTRIRLAEQAARDYRLSGLPALAIDGKYVVSASRGMEPAALFGLADEVLAKARAERGRK